MPAKRKAAAKGAKGKGSAAKKAKVEDAPAALATMKDAAEALKAEDKKKGGKKAHKVDSNCPMSSAEVSIICYKLHVHVYIVMSIYRTMLKMCFLL
mgnify:CR=1 FL=1